jgi:hypothetical protein
VAASFDAISASATPSPLKGFFDLNTRTMRDLPVTDWVTRSASAAMRSARSGSVAASVPAMSASALTLSESLVIDWAMRSASARSRAARSGWVAASVPAMSASALT